MIEHAALLRELAPLRRLRTVTIVYQVYRGANNEADFVQMQSLAELCCACSSLELLNLQVVGLDVLRQSARCTWQDGTQDLRAALAELGRAGVSIDLLAE